MKKRSQARRPAEAPPQRGGVPPNFRETLHWQITQSSWRLTVVNLLAVPTLVVFGILFFGWAALFNRLTLNARYGVNYGVDFVVAIVAMLVLHEALHGLAMVAYGARPRFGILWQALMFYTTAPGYAFRRNDYVVVVLAPLVGLSLLALMGVVVASPSAALLLVGVATLNAAGAVGDIWILSVVLRYPAHAYVMDEKDGLRIFLPA